MTVRRYFTCHATDVDGVAFQFPVQATDVDDALIESRIASAFTTDHRIVDPEA